MSGKRLKIIKDSSKYLLATVFSQGAGLVRTLALTIIFSPSQLGIWNFMNVIVGYGANAHLGLLHGMNKMVPALKIGNDASRFQSVKDSVWWINGLLGAIAGLITFVSSYFVSSNYARELRIVSLIVFSQMIFTYLFCLLRAESRFTNVSAGIALFSALSTVLAIALAYLHPDPLLGALWGLFLANVLTAVYWAVSAGYRFQYVVSLQEVRGAFYLGLPLILLGVVDMCFLSVDRWVIAAKFGPKELGYYAIAIMVVNIMGLAATSLSNVLFPLMVEKFALKQGTAGTENVLLLPLNAVAAIMPLVILPVVVFLPIFIEILMPKYMPSIPLFSIMLPAAFFLSTASIAGTYVISINRQIILTIAQLLAIGVALLADYLFISLGYGVKGVSYGMFIGYLFSGMSYVGAAIYFATGALKRTLNVMLQIILPFMVMLFGIFFMDAYAVRWIVGWGGAKFALSKLLLVGLPLLSVLVLMHRRGRMWELVREELRTICGNRMNSLVSQ